MTLLRRVLLALGLVAINVRIACAQPNCPSPPPNDHLPSLDIHRRDKASITKLRTDLGNQCWAAAIADYLGKYEDHLLTWVVYIDSTGAVHQGLSRLEGTRPIEVETDERYVWAMVFSDLKVGVTSSAGASASKNEDENALRVTVDKDGTVHFASVASAPPPDPRDNGDAPPPRVPKDTFDIRYIRRVVVHQRDPALTLLLKSLGKAVGFDGAVDPSLADSATIVRLGLASDDDTPLPLYAGFSRFGVVGNAEIELAVSPLPGQGFVARNDNDSKLQSVYTNLAIARRRGFEVGLMAGVSYGAAPRTFTSTLQVQTAGSHVAASMYAIAAFNIARAWYPLPWREEWQRGSVGLVLGTNVLNGSLGSDLIAGASFGHLFSDAGVTLASDWANESRVANGIVVNSRRPRLLVGLDFRL